MLGAGLGTRLRPLTNVLPKPLLPIFGKPLITFALDHLRQAGIEKFWINTHHLPDKFSAMFSAAEYKGAHLELVFEENLLETGGGMKNLEKKIGDEVFIVYSGDLLTDVPFARLVDEHFSRQNDVTLALRETGLSTGISWQPESGRIVDFFGALGSGRHGGIRLRRYFRLESVGFFPDSKSDQNIIRSDPCRMAQIGRTDRRCASGRESLVQYWFENRIFESAPNHRERTLVA